MANEQPKKIEPSSVAAPSMGSASTAKKDYAKEPYIVDPNGVVVKLTHGSYSDHALGKHHKIVAPAFIRVSEEEAKLMVAAKVAVHHQD